MGKRQRKIKEIKTKEDEVGTDEHEPAYQHKGDVISYEHYKKQKARTGEAGDDSPSEPELEEMKLSAEELPDPHPSDQQPEAKELIPSPRIKRSFFDLFSNDLAIDLGTANTLIYKKGKGIVLDEPSVVALRRNGRGQNKVLTVGTDAKKMLGKVPGNITAIRPMRDGVVADFEIAGIMIRHFIRKVRSGLRIFKPRVIVAIPSGITPVERRAVKEAAEQAGARQVFLIEEPMAAAIGAGLPITEPTCSMVVDIGGGTTEVAVISLAGIVSSKSLRMAGDKMDTAIMQYIKRKYNFIIGESTAEMIKNSIGNASPDIQKPETMEVKGRSMVTGIPGIITIDSLEIWEAIVEQISSIVHAVKTVLEHTPPELGGDIVDDGIILTGGVALLKNLDKYLSEETGLQIKVAETPLSTVATGSGKAIDSMKILKQVMLR